MEQQLFYRGDIWMVDLHSGVYGSEQGGKNYPCLILQNDTGNRFSQTVIVATISSSQTKKRMPTHVKLDSKKYGLMKDSFIGLESIKTVDKWRCFQKLTEVDDEILEQVDNAIDISIKGKRTQQRRWA